MESLRLKQLQQRAIENVTERISDANNATMASRIGELNSLHVAASMNIEKTLESLKQVLVYKKEVSKQMLQSLDEKEMKYFAEIIKQADDMIKKILGMHIS